MLIKKDIINLRDAALNQAVRLQDKTTVIVRRYARSTKEKNNCASCVFRERGIDASRCEYTLACFAHNRPDREPVYFEEVKKKVEGRWNISLNKPYIVQNFEQNEDIPAFTLQDILDLLPAKHEGAYLTITKTDKSYIMGYEDEDGGASPVFINEQAIDSAYEMMCWCAENGIIETKKDK